MGEVVEHVVTDHDVVPHAVVDAVIVVLPVGVGLDAALLTGPEPPDIVNHVAVDSQVVRVSGHAHDPTGAPGADVADVVEMILHQDDVVVPGDVLPAAVRLHCVAAGVADLEAFHADVVAVDLEPGGRAVVLTVHDHRPAVRGPEYEPGGRGTAAGDRHDVGTTGVDAVVHDRGVAGVQDVGRVLDRPPRRGARAGVGVIAVHVHVAARGGAARCGRGNREGRASALALARRRDRGRPGHDARDQPAHRHGRHRRAARRPRHHAPRQRIATRVLGRRSAAVATV